MLGKKDNKIVNGKFASTLACLLIIGFVSDVANSQVVIVKGKERAPRTAPKPRTKTKPRPSAVPTPISESTVGTTASVSPSNDVSSSRSSLPESLAFVIIPKITSPKTAPKSVPGPLAFTIVPPKLETTAAKEDVIKNNTPQTQSVPEAGVKNNPAVKEEGIKNNAPQTQSAPEAGVKNSPAVVTNPKNSGGSTLPASRLSSFGFDVITSDDRGRISGRRVETARFFLEELAGGISLEMVQIPAGNYMMGSLETEVAEEKKEYGRGVEREIKEALIRRLNWETPQHMVKIPAFYMSKYEITQAQWRAVASLPKVNRELVSDPSQFKGSNRPVEKVSWEEAVEFCERLSRATGRRYRLPAEAEWEYACRAGTDTPFHFGDSIKTDWANYQGKYTYSNSPKGEFREQTLPVGSIGVANAFGLQDMHGNVWEWCRDVWHESYEAAPEDGSAWDKGKILYLKILRGGAWDSTAGECRSNSRNRMTSTIRLNNVGFRVVAEITEQ